MLDLDLKRIRCPKAAHATREHVASNRSNRAG